MINFRDFRNQMIDRVENYRTLSNSMVKGDQGKIDPNGYPCAVVYHGGHSKPDKKRAKDDKKEPKKVVKEATQKTEWDEVHDNGHLGDNVNQVHKKLMDDYGDRKPSHHAAIHAYTKSSNHLNSTLYEKHIFDEPVPNKINAHQYNQPGDHVHDIHTLDSALAHKPLEHHLHVYSGLSFDPNEIADKHPDRHIHLPAYTSTSIDKKVATNFAANYKHDSSNKTHPLSTGHVLHISLPKGHHGSYVGSDSMFTHEKEFTMSRNTTLHIHPTPTDHETVYGDKIKVWHATPVEHKQI